MTEKEAILRDLKVIAILDDKIDYSDHENIGAVLKLNPKSLFSTEYGDRYLERIRKMYDGDDYDHTCILCGDPLDGDGPICSKCYKMITTGSSQRPQMPEPIHTETDEAPEPTPAEAPVEEVEEPEEVQEPQEDEVEETPEEAQEEPVEVSQPQEEPEEAAEEPAEPEETPGEPESEKAEPVTPIVSFDAEAAKNAAAAAEEEQKEEDGFADDAKEVQNTYNEIEQDVVDPKAKRIYLWRALIMLFVVACFAIGIVCGLVLMIRRAGGTQQTYGQVTEQQMKKGTGPDFIFPDTEI